MFLLIYDLEYGRHLAPLRRCRAYAFTSDAASHENYGVTLLPYIGMGLRLAALLAAEAPLQLILLINLDSLRPFCVLSLCPYRRIPPVVHNPLGEYICLPHLSHMTYPSDESSNFYSGIHFDT